MQKPSIPVVTPAGADNRAAVGEASGGLRVDKAEGLRQVTRPAGHSRDGAAEGAGGEGRDVGCIFCSPIRMNGSSEARGGTLDEPHAPGANPAIARPKGYTPHMVKFTFWLVLAAASCRPPTASRSLKIC